MRPHLEKKRCWPFYWVLLQEISHRFSQVWLALGPAKWCTMINLKSCTSMKTFLSCQVKMLWTLTYSRLTSASKGKLICFRITFSSHSFIIYLEVNVLFLYSLFVEHLILIIKKNCLRVFPILRFFPVLSHILCSLVLFFAPFVYVFSSITIMIIMSYVG